MSSVKNNVESTFMLSKKILSEPFFDEPNLPLQEHIINVMNNNIMGENINFLISVCF